MDVRAASALPPAGLDVLAGAANIRPGDNRAVEKVAGEFESMVLSLVLKQMRQTLEAGGFFGEDKADVRGGLFDLYLGQHLAKGGGFGLAALMKQHLKARTTDEPANGSPPSPPRPV